AGVAVFIDGGHLVAVAQLDRAAGGGANFALDDLAAADAAGVEGPHRELRTRLADRLGGDDAHGHAGLDHLAAGHVHPVVVRRAAGGSLAGQRRTHHHGVEVQFVLDLAGHLDRDHLVLANDDLVGERVDDVRAADAADDLVAQRHVDLLTLVDGALDDAALGTAVQLRDDHRLGDVAEFAGEVTRVGRLERGVGQTLAGAVRRREV